MLDTVDYIILTTNPLNPLILCFEYASMITKPLLENFFTKMLTSTLNSHRFKRHFHRCYFMHYLINSQHTCLVFRLNLYFKLSLWLSLVLFACWFDVWKFEIIVVTPPLFNSGAGESVSGSCLRFVFLLEDSLDFLSFVDESRG